MPFLPANAVQVGFSDRALATDAAGKGACCRASLRTRGDATFTEGAGNPMMVTVAMRANVAWELWAWTVHVLWQSMANTNTTLPDQS